MNQIQQKSPDTAFTKAMFALKFLILYIAIVTIIQAYKCPELTQTQLFIRIPSSFILDFIECDSDNLENIYHL